MAVFVYVGVALAIAVLIFFFMKSSKEMPKNWSQFVSELKVQHCGFVGIMEDLFLRGANKVSKYRTSNGSQI